MSSFKETTQLARMRLLGMWGRRMFTLCGLNMSRLYVGLQLNNLVLGEGKKKLLKVTEVTFQEKTFDFVASCSGMKPEKSKHPCWLCVALSSFFNQEQYKMFSFRGEK